MKKNKYSFNELIKEYDCSLIEAKELYSMLQFLRIKPILESPIIHYGDMYTIIPVGR